MINRTILFTAMLMCTAAIYAQPVLTPLDSTVYNAGTIREGSTTLVKHTFKIKNTGNAPLKISSVRAHCGCTVVGFDSTVAPGKTGTISSQIDLTNLRGGDLTKSITVISNASNRPEQLFSTRFNYIGYIAAAPDYVVLTKAAAGRNEASLILTTDRPTLRVQKVMFNGDMASAPRPLVFSLAQFDTGLVLDKLHRYKLAIIATGVNTERAYGEFVISTDHPKKPELKFGGMIEDNR